MRKKREIVQLGKFENNSGVFIVSDPCYDQEDLDNGCGGKLENVSKGKWFAFVEYSEEGVWDRRCSKLYAIHKSKVNNWEDQFWKSLNADIGVDSGQAGIFSKEIYRNNENVILPDDTPANWKDDNIWYLSCCDKTLRKDQAGVIPGGVVSSSGYGDGSYDCYYITNKENEIVGVSIIFIEDNEEEEDW